MNGRIDAQLYWSLPGPRRFVSNIASSMQYSRLLVLNFPDQLMPGTWDRVRQGLEDGYADDVIELSVRDGVDVGIDIGHHFDRQRVTAGQLAAIDYPRKRAIVLKAIGDEAQQKCWQYGYDFLSAANTADGNVRLVVSLSDGNFLEDGVNDKIINFDGGLSPDEMEAYVGLRLIGRTGPGSTGLLKAIVCEFAGFDACFAERLMDLDDHNIVCIRDHLDALENEAPDRWRLGSWESGCKSSAGVRSNHVLFDAYLAKSGNGVAKEAALARIDQRYWRACVKVLTPWIEERRRAVIRFLQKQLEQHAAQFSGKVRVARGDGRFFDIDLDDIEYNNIAGLAKYGEIKPGTDKELAAVSVCKAVKRVRDEIAHLRAPLSEDVSKMIREMDRLLTA